MTLKLLLVEDDAPTLSQLGDVLEGERFTVIRAADGNAGLEQFVRENADIVITDLKMPGMTGLDLMRKVKELRPEVPVILTTAYGETDTAIDALRAGALDYFKKPIELDELLLAVGRAREVALRNAEVEDFPTVLLAEDDDVTRKNLAEVLEKEGWHVITAADGQQAVDVFRTSKVDILLADIKMPRLDGIKALGAMRALRQDFEAIILTGYGDETTAIQALRNGAMSFVRKPVDLDEVLVTLEKAKQKLGVERALRYRTREVDLAQQIIAQISAHGEIVMRLSDATLESAKEQVVRLLSDLSDALALVDEHGRVVFGNRRFRDLSGAVPERLDSAFWVALAAASQGGLSSQQLSDCVERVWRGSVGASDSIASGEHRLVCVKARARVGAETCDYVVLLWCGRDA